MWRQTEGGGMGLATSEGLSNLCCLMIGEGNGVPRAIAGIFSRGSPGYAMNRYVDDSLNVWDAERPRL